MWPFDSANQSMSKVGLTFEQKNKMHNERHRFLPPLFTSSYLEFHWTFNLLPALTVFLVSSGRYEVRTGVFSPVQF